MSNVPFNLCEGHLVLVVCGKPYNIEKGDHRFLDLIDAIKTDKEEDEFLEILERQECVIKEKVLPDKFLEFKEISVDGDDIYYGDERIDDTLLDEVAALRDLDMPLGGIMKFIERCYNNMEERARTELLSFIKNCGLTIDSEGFIIAYKAVRQNYMDKHSNTIDWSVGQIPKMNRDLVENDPSKACGEGLHAGGLGYVKKHGNHGDRIVIVKIDPFNVVSIPYDSGCQKLRCCEVEVIGDYEGELLHTVYDSNSSTKDMYDYDEEYDDYDEEEDYWDDWEDDYEDLDEEPLDNDVEDSKITFEEEVDSTEQKPPKKSKWSTFKKLFKK